MSIQCPYYVQTQMVDHFPFPFINQQESSNFCVPMAWIMSSPTWIMSSPTWIMSSPTDTGEEKGLLKEEFRTNFGFCTSRRGKVNSRFKQGKNC